MKIGTLLSVAGAFIALFALASPAEAQHHGGSGHFGGGYAHNGNSHYGYGGHGGYYHGHSHVNFYFGGFGYPYYGYPYYGYPYYGYPYGYGYAPYGYGYYSAPIANYTYDPQGIYQGRVVRRGDHQHSIAAQVQEQLAAAGYYHGQIDGVIGAKTRRAIRNYERANNLEVDGRIGDELLSTMGLG
jgi:hypothetical protein